MQVWNTVHQLDKETNQVIKVPNVHPDKKEKLKFKKKYVKFKRFQGFKEHFIFFILRGFNWEVICFYLVDILTKTWNGLQVYSAGIGTRWISIFRYILLYF